MFVLVSLVSCLIYKGYPESTEARLRNVHMVNRVFVVSLQLYVYNFSKSILTKNLDYDTIALQASFKVPIPMPNELDHGNSHNVTSLQGHLEASCFCFAFALLKVVELLTNTETTSGIWCFLANSFALNHGQLHWVWPEGAGKSLI